MLSQPSRDEVFQGSKLASMHAKSVRWDHDFERQLTHRLKLPRFVGHIASPVLCVGARLGAEVKAFRAAVPGLLSVGIDYNPGDRNPFVMWGDAQSLQFSPNSLAVLYTNVLDHIRNTSIFAREAHRVLKPNGTLWVEMDQKKPGRSQGETSARKRKEQRREASTWRTACGTSRAPQTKPYGQAWSARWGS